MALSTESRPRATPLLAVFPGLFAAVFLTHRTLLALPYYWDECAYYIPTAWDLFHNHILISQSDVANIHPPLPAILLTLWWHLTRFTPFATRIFICLVTAAALTGVFRLAQRLAGSGIAAATTLLTALYPIWFAQSTLAHADIFAAAFTLWAISLYLSPAAPPPFPEIVFVPRNQSLPPLPLRHYLGAATLFALAGLSKETAIVTPAALTLLELYRATRSPITRRNHIVWAVSLAATAIPLTSWYACHYLRTGSIFGPGYVQYNATANLDALRIALSFYHRILHMTMHMNLFVATGCALAALLMPKLPARRRLPPPAIVALTVILAANLIEYSIFGGALLTRYLLPCYPLILLLCVVEWRLHFKRWPAIVALAAVAFIAGIFLNPPYPFATEDNLTYADVIRLHQQAISLIATRYPEAIVLSADPVIQQLEKPELGYTPKPIKTVPIRNFTYEELQKAAQDPAAYDTALLFSTKWVPPPGHLNLSAGHEAGDTRYFDFHHDLTPNQAARLLQGEVVWQATRNGAWAAVLRFPRAMNAALPSRPTKLPLRSSPVS